MENPRLDPVSNYPALRANYDIPVAQDRNQCPSWNLFGGLQDALRCSRMLGDSLGIAPATIPHRIWIRDKHGCNTHRIQLHPTKTGVEQQTQISSVFWQRESKQSEGEGGGRETCTASQWIPMDPSESQWIPTGHQESESRNKVTENNEGERCWGEGVRESMERILATAGSEM